MKELNEARVLAVGPGGLDKEGKRVTPSVTPGDKVLIPQVREDYMTLKSAFEIIADRGSQYGGSPVKVGDEEYSLFRDHE